MERTHWLRERRPCRSSGRECLVNEINQRILIKYMLDHRTIEIRSTSISAIDVDRISMRRHPAIYINYVRERHVQLKFKDFSCFSHRMTEVKV